MLYFVYNSDLIQRSYLILQEEPNLELHSHTHFTDYMKEL